MNYDIEYYEKMLLRNSETSEKMCSIRWDWIWYKTIKKVLDYGSGVGWFRAYRPNGVEVDSYDIGDYPQTGIKLKVYDIVTFWDVLEHIQSFDELEPVLRLANAVAGTIPIKPNEIEWNAWKHCY